MVVFKTLLPMVVFASCRSRKDKSLCPINLPTKSQLSNDTKEGGGGPKPNPPTLSEISKPGFVPENFRSFASFFGIEFVFDDLSDIFDLQPVFPDLIF